MEINPHAVRTHEFPTVRRGLDPDQVGSFLAEVADELERAQNHATAMEARARAAVQRIQELTEAAPPAPAEAPAPVSPSVEEAETISRTLLLAQRTADTTVADARAEAERLLAEANEEATGLVDGAREERAQLVEVAREDARREGETERALVREEADAMRSRRDALRADVEHLEQFLVAQRERLRDAATTLLDLTERIPGGLGHVAEPLLTSDGEDTGPIEQVAGEQADVAETAVMADEDGDGEDTGPIERIDVDAPEDVAWASDLDGPAAGDEAGPVGDATPVGGDVGAASSRPSTDLSFDLSDER
jgi:DivIVA domain-containing protein